MINYLRALLHAWTLRRRFPDRTTPASQMWPIYLEQLARRRMLEKERRMRAMVARTHEGSDGTELPSEPPDPLPRGGGLL